MECPAFLRGLKCAGRRGGGRIHSQGGDLYHMYDADIALPVVGEEVEYGRVRTGQAVQCPWPVQAAEDGGDPLEGCNGYRKGGCLKWRRRCTR